MKVFYIKGIGDALFPCVCFGPCPTKALRLSLGKALFEALLPVLALRLEHHILPVNLNGKGPPAGLPVFPFQEKGDVTLSQVGQSELVFRPCADGASLKRAVGFKKGRAALPLIPKQGRPRIVIDVVGEGDTVGKLPVLLPNAGKQLLELLL